MKLTTKESLKKDKQYLQEVLELYNRDIFADYIVGIHLKPNKDIGLEPEKMKDVLVNTIKKVKNDVGTAIKIGYTIFNEVVFYIQANHHPFNSRLQDILSYVNGIFNVILIKELEKQNVVIDEDNPVFYFGNIYGFRNNIAAYKLILTLYREYNTIVKRKWVEEVAKEHNIEITGNLLRDELKIASETGRGFDEIPKWKIYGVLIDENNNEIIPTFNFSETIELLNPLLDNN